MYKKTALIALLIILGLVNWSIAEKEKHLAKGRIVYLKLAPVDPRSLMQGDYMALRFALADKVNAASDGYIIVSLDKQKIASFQSIYNEQSLAKNEVLMRYHVRNGAVKFATNAFFFQEGNGKLYETAQYGGFRVDDKGELLLVAMYNEALHKLEPSDKE